MKCADARAYIEAFIDSELTAAENLEVQAHLNRCVSCSGLYEGEERLRGILEEKLSTGKAPERLRARILSSIRPPARTMRHRRSIVAAAGILILPIAGLFLFTALETDELIASQLVAQHEATREGYCGSNSPDRVCVGEECTDNPRATLRDFFARHGTTMPCLHDLSSLGYGLAGGAVWTHKRWLICWTTQRHGEGRTISHGQVPSRVLREEVSTLLQVNGRTVLLVSASRTGMT